MIRRQRSVILAALALFLAAGLLPAQSEQAAPAPAQSDKPKPEELTPEKRADIFMARKMYREAIEQYKKLPETAVTLNKVGIAYHQLMDLRTAERYYKRAIKADKAYPEAVNNLGTVYYAKKSYRKAVGQYKRALKISPYSASIYSNLGTAHFARKKYDDAVTAYQEALKIDPDVFDHKSSFGIMLRETNIEERAKFHYFLAKNYAAAGMFDRALLSIRRSLENGFKDKQKYMEEPEFEKMREMAEFKELMTADIRALE